MKIEKLGLENFRCFTQLEVDFHPRLNVIVGVNGAGKTSILDGIAVLMGRFLSKLPEVKGIALKQSDLRMLSAETSAPAVRCYLKTAVDTGGVEWSISKARDSSKKTKKQLRSEMRFEWLVGFKQIDQYANRLIEADNDLVDYEMPLIAYYGTSRATFSVPMKRRNFKKKFARFDGLTGALNPSANFKRVFEWIHAKENEELREQKHRQSFDYKDVELQAVVLAIENFFPSFKNPRIKLKPLEFVLDSLEDKKTYSLNQLSDGYRTTLALVADLACRMVEANPPSTTNLKSALETEAIVLIDEIELHLHPGWQQTILVDLMRTFPNTQFIVTTHSPQVLSSCEPECIQILDWTKDGIATLSTPDFSLGAESHVVLETILGVRPRPTKLDISIKLQQYLTLVNDDLWDSEEAKRLRTELDAWGAGKEPALTEADLDIRVRQWRRNQASS